MNRKEVKLWNEFKDSGLLWWVNSQLRLFGMSIYFKYDENGDIVSAYPARCKSRGFREEENINGYVQVTDFIQKMIPYMLNDINYARYINKPARTLNLIDVMYEGNIYSEVDVKSVECEVIAKLWYNSESKSITETRTSNEGFYINIFNNSVVCMPYPISAFPVRFFSENEKVKWTYLGSNKVNESFESMYIPILCLIQYYDSLNLLEQMLNCDNLGMENITLFEYCCKFKRELINNLKVSNMNDDFIKNLINHMYSQNDDIPDNFKFKMDDVEKLYEEKRYQTLTNDTFKMKEPKTLNLVDLFSTLNQSSEYKCEILKKVWYDFKSKSISNSKSSDDGIYINIFNNSIIAVPHPMGCIVFNFVIKYNTNKYHIVGVDDEGYEIERSYTFISSLIQYLEYNNLLEYMIECSNEIDTNTTLSEYTNNFKISLINKLKSSNIDDKVLRRIESAMK